MQKLKKHRASANRFYYSAFSAVTAECRKKKTSFSYGYEHPPHRELGKEMKKLFTHMTRQDRDDLRDAVKRLYDARIDADYHANVQLGDPEIRNAMRDAQFFLNSLGVGNMTEQEVIALVEQRLAQHQPPGYKVEVVPGTVRQDGEWWYIAVRPDQPNVPRYDYYNVLAVVEREIQDEDETHNILLVPAAAGAA